MQEEFQYYAFISYCHADEKWAKWLQKRLENYKLPSVVRSESSQQLPKYVRPVFRDKTDIATGKLEKTLKEELTESKYLIVICSPSAAKSEWVNKEILAFQGMGREDLIIPFIVSGNPSDQAGEEQCYPPALMNSDDEFLGASLCEVSKDKAFVRILATILGLKFDQLYRRHLCPYSFSQSR